jgi:hypothetical protein
MRSAPHPRTRRPLKYTLSHTRPHTQHTHIDTHTHTHALTHSLSHILTRTRTRIHLLAPEGTRAAVFGLLLHDGPANPKLKTPKPRQPRGYGAVLAPGAKPGTLQATLFADTSVGACGLTSLNPPPQTGSCKLVFKVGRSLMPPPYTLDALHRCRHSQWLWFLGAQCSLMLLKARCMVLEMLHIPGCPM